MSPDDCVKCITYLGRDAQLLLSLHPTGSDRSMHVKYTTAIVGYQMACLLFQNVYKDYMMKRNVNAEYLKRLLEIVQSGAKSQSIAVQPHNDIWALLTTLCLFHTRWFLLRLSNNISHVIIWPGWVPPNPWDILSSLQPRAEESLITLHNHDCCPSALQETRRHSLADHVAARNALTMIARLLKADTSERDHLLTIHLEYARICQQGSPFTEWIAHYPNTKSRHMASREFIDVLCSAELHSWMKFGSDFSEVPLPETQQGRLLRTAVPDTDMTFIGVLRELAERVTFDYLHVGSSPSQMGDWPRTSSMPIRSQASLFNPRSSSRQVLAPSPGHGSIPLTPL
ncbi:hypothetical protein PENSPDRAFT_672032 [Peniophora sp. CONT]|nr:hypothetical protein PENSPDRAFT_672032 [Peniophora sp. CONT]